MLHCTVKVRKPLFPKHVQSCFHLQSVFVSKGGYKKKKRWREGGGGAIIRGGDYVKYFLLRGVII